MDSNSLTKTKNWNGRNEVIENSGRLHPLWPQDKRLHTPRTTDYRHTRQDRWIQTELVSTFVKNATKPNPFQIVLLQTTKKENNWKTEETMERAVVTLETERIKGSNPWCLWWWWWCWWNCMFFPKELYSSSYLLRLKKKVCWINVKTDCSYTGCAKRQPTSCGCRMFYCRYIVTLALCTLWRRRGIGGMAPFSLD